MRHRKQRSYHHELKLTAGSQSNLRPRCANNSYSLDKLAPICRCRVNRLGASCSFSHLYYIRFSPTSRLPTMLGEPIRMLEVTRTHDNTAAVHTKIIGLLRARGQSRERYASLRNRSRTQAADALIAEIRAQIGELEQREGKRIYKRRAASEVKLVTAIERFAGDLLRVRTGMKAPSNVYRAIGRSRFDDDKVKYDLFTQVLSGLKTLGLVFHLKGRARYRKTPFGNAPERGQAARFWATGKLMRLAARYGIHATTSANTSPLSPPRTPSS